MSVMEFLRYDGITLKVEVGCALGSLGVKGVVVDCVLGLLAVGLLSVGFIVSVEVSWS